LTESVSLFTVIEGWLRLGLEGLLEAGFNIGAGGATSFEKDTPRLVAEGVDCSEETSVEA